VCARRTSESEPLGHPVALNAVVNREEKQTSSENPFDLFGNLSDGVGNPSDKFGENRLAEMLVFSTVLEYRPGEQVIVGGAESRSLYYVEKGSVEVSYRLAETRMVVALIGPSSFFGEIGFFDGVSRVRDIRAIQDTTVRLFDNENVLHMRDEDPVLYGDFIALMARSICEKFRRVVEEREPVTAYAASLAGGRRGFEELKPVPRYLAKTQGWRFLDDLVEDFKRSFFDLSYRLQEDRSDEIPDFLRDRSWKIMDDFNLRLQSAEDFLKDDEVAEHAWGYAFKEIFPYFMRSRFAERAYYKPRGYAGDHLMMEMIYANRPEGDGKLGLLMDSWCLNSSAARAVRGRRKFLTGQLEALCAQSGRGSETIRIMNLACGSSRELFDFLAGCQYTERVSVFCIDADPSALEYVHRYVDVFPHRASISLMNDNVVRWASGRVRHSFGLQDVIYSAGLTDYLDDRVCAALINRSYECLEDGGTLIIGNFGYGNSNKPFLDHILKWSLIHRSEEDLLNVFSRTPFDGHVKIMAEENRINLFAVATKVP